MIRKRFSCPTAVILFGFLSLTVSPPPADSGQNDTRLVLTLPDLSWALEIAEPGFTIKEKKFNDRVNGAMLMAVNPTTQVNLSAFLEKAAKKGDAKACRDYYWERAKEAPTSMKDVRMFESGQMAIVEYNIGTEKITQKNAHAYLAMGDYWIDVHLSQISFKPGTEDPFSSILKHIGINESYVPTAKEHFGYASYYYLKKDYAKAAEHYEHVVDRAKPETTLSRDIWRVAVDQLWMSYGLNGEPAKAKDVFEWAIPKDPEYPLFYYNLACASAELGSPEEALRNLRLAYQYKGNMLSGKSFPDPKKDPSFKKYLKDKHFRAELDKMK